VGITRRQSGGQALRHGSGQDLVGQALPETDGHPHILEPKIPWPRDQCQLPGGASSALPQRLGGALLHERAVTGVGEQIAVGRHHAGHHELEIAVRTLTHPMRQHVDHAPGERCRVSGQRQHDPVLRQHPSLPIRHIEWTQGTDEGDTSQTIRQRGCARERVGSTARNAYYREAPQRKLIRQCRNIRRPRADAAPGLKRRLPESRPIDGQEPEAEPPGRGGRHTSLEARSGIAVEVQHRGT